jgi:hypothetical protein
MFYVCDVIVLALVSFALCCAPSHACSCFYLFLSRVSVFAAFERVLYPPSSAYQSIYGKLMRHLRVGFCLFIKMCAAFEWAFILHSRTRDSFIHQHVCRLRVGFRFTFENLIVIYSSSCALPLSGLLFRVRELDTRLIVVL